MDYLLCKAHKPWYNYTALISVDCLALLSSSTKYFELKLAIFTYADFRMLPQYQEQCVRLVAKQALRAVAGVAVEHVMFSAT